MSRYNIPQEQIDRMDMDTLSDLLTTMQQEMCDLAGLEYSLYTRRRALEKELNPELFVDAPQDTQQTDKRKLSNAQMLKLITAAQNRGISLEDILT